MSHLSLVKPLSHFHEERRHTDEVLLDSFGLAFTRGSVIEAAGPASSGRTAIALSLLARLTSVGEICAIVECGNGFDPYSAVLAGVLLENLLWVRCGDDIEKAFMAADYLVQAKGFGAIWLNLSGLPHRKLRLVPRTYWYRYRTRIKETPTMLFVTADEHLTGSASQQSFELTREEGAKWSGKGRFKLLRELRINIHSRKDFYGGPLQARIKAVYEDV